MCEACNIDDCNCEKIDTQEAIVIAQIFGGFLQNSANGMLELIKEFDEQKKEK